MNREFSVIIEKDEDGYFVASVPTLKGCHTQAKSLDLLMKRVKEAIELCLEVGDTILNDSLTLRRFSLELSIVSPEFCTETNGSAAAFFRFSTGERDGRIQSSTYDLRVLPVRSIK